MQTDILAQMRTKIQYRFCFTTGPGGMLHIFHSGHKRRFQLREQRDYGFCADFPAALLRSPVIGCVAGALARRVTAIGIYDGSDSELGGIHILEQGGGLRQISDLKNYTLLHCSYEDLDLGWPDWAMWLAVVEAGDVDATHGIYFNQSELLIQAALDGQGVALVGSVMAESDIAAGRFA